MSVKIKIAILTIVAVVLVGGIFYLWNATTGYFSIGADTITGCQGNKLVTAFIGKPGKNLVTYNLFGHDVSVNSKITGSLDLFQAEVNAANTGYSFDDIQTYNLRRKTGGGGYSMHSWGIALDLNPTRNPYQPGRRKSIQTDIPTSIIQIFNKHGFQWGGDWVGESDPMHFEWYGSTVSGNIINRESGQKIEGDSIVTVDDLPMNLDKGSFNWTLPATHPHNLLAASPGYESTSSKFETTCFQSKTMDISLTPLSAILAGKISGRVTLPGGGLPLVPVKIYLDGELVTTTNNNGEYVITNVRRGVHTVGTQILFAAGSQITTPEVMPQENLTDINIVLGG